MALDVVSSENNVSFLGQFNWFIEKKKDFFNIDNKDNIIKMNNQNSLLKNKQKSSVYLYKWLIYDPKIEFI